MKEAKSGKLQGWKQDSKLRFDLFMHVTHRYWCLLWASICQILKTQEKPTVPTAWSLSWVERSQIQLLRSGEADYDKAKTQMSNCKGLIFHSRHVTSRVAPFQGSFFPSSRIRRMSNPHLEPHRLFTEGKGSPGRSLSGSYMLWPRMTSCHFHSLYLLN